MPFVLLTIAVAACSTPREPDRVIFGVAGDRAATDTTPASDEAMRRFLDRKVNQICTLGYATLKVRTIPAEDGRALVAEDVRCNDYMPSFFFPDLF